jgi:hypothetical protein
MRGHAPEQLAIHGVIERLRQVFGAATDLELAAKMGVGRTAPSNWRNRNSIPYDLCATVARDHGVSLDWLIFGAALPTMRAGASVGHERSAEAQRLSQFVDFWDQSRPHNEMVWLEHQVRRAIPEYADWSPAGEG